MSGIVGDVGSRSGVIGITQLDYEEGVYTPVPNAGSINSISQNRYRKIGGMCFLEAYFGDIQTPGFSTLSGLPFPTNPAGSGYESATGTIMANGPNWSDGTVNICCYIYNNNFYFYQSRDNTGWANMSGWATGNDIFFSCHYMCAKSGFTI